MQTYVKLLFVAVFMLSSTATAQEKGLTVKSVRYFSYSAFTRIVFEIEEAAPYTQTKSADGKIIFVSSYDGPFTLTSPLPVIHDSIVDAIEVKEEAGRKVIMIHLGAGAGETKDFALRGPDRIVLDIAKGSAPAPLSQTEKRIVIMLDPGHGGKDTGIVSVQGQEKSIALDLAHAIKRILQKNQNLKVILTREKDQALPLDERAIEANGKGAGVFVSIHTAPGSQERVFIQDPDEDAGEQRGRTASTDFLRFEAGSRQDELVWGKQQAAYAKESGLLGRMLARELSGRDDSEPVQAPMAGLKAVNAPAVVIEAGMEQDRLKTAEAVAKGIERYVGQNR